MLTPTSNYFAVLLPGMLATGIGTGLTFVGCTSTGMGGVAPRDSGVASGLLNTSVQCGAALGLGALAAIGSAVTRSQQAGHAPAVALTNGYVAGLLAGAVGAQAGPRVPLPRQPQPDQGEPRLVSVDERHLVDHQRREPAGSDHRHGARVVG